MSTTTVTLTNQTALDKVWDAFIRRSGAFSYDAQMDMCFYRQNGWRCAIGVLIPDSIYEPAWELYTADKLWHDNLKFRSYFKACDGQFLRDLQEAHDESCRGFYKQGHLAIRHEFATQLLAIAQDWGLSKDALTVDED